MKLSDFDTEMIKEGQQGALRPNDPEPQELGQEFNLSQDELNHFTDDIENTGGNGGYMDIFIREVSQSLDTVMESIRNNPNVNSMDQSLLSIMENFQHELIGSVTIDRVYQIFGEAINQINSNGSEHSTKLTRILKDLLRRFATIFAPEQEDMTAKPVLISLMVRHAFGFTPDDKPGQTYQLHNAPAGTTTVQNNYPDSRVIKKTEDEQEFPTQNSLSMEAEKRMGDLATQVYKHLSDARGTAYTLYIQALDYKGDVEMKSGLIESSSKMTRKLDMLIEAIQSMHYKINHI